MATVSLMDGLLDMDGAAKHLGISRRALRDFCNRGAITVANAARTVVCQS
jgi:hypothetical protein